jgi:Tryptophan halogenase
VWLAHIVRNSFSRVAERGRRDRRVGRCPLPPGWRRPTTLRENGSENGLSDDSSRARLGRRQRRVPVKHRLPDLRVTVLRSKDIGIIGVGEGTTVPVLRHVHGYLRIDHADFHRVAQPTWKLGVRFLWGPRPYFDYGLSTQLDVRYEGVAKVIGVMRSTP